MLDSSISLAEHWTGEEQRTIQPRLIGTVAVTALAPIVGYDVRSHDRTASAEGIRCSQRCSGHCRPA